MSTIQLNYNKLTSILLVLLFVSPLPGFAENSTELKNKMKSIDNRLKNLNKNNRDNEQTSDGISDRLKLLKKQIDDSSAALLAIEGKTQNVEDRINSINRQKAHLTEQIEKQQNIISVHAYLAWQAMKSKQFSLLEANSVSEQSRLEEWSRYFRKNRIEAVTNMNRDKKALSTLISREKAAIDDLADLSSRYKKETETYKKLQTSNKKKVAQLKARIKKNNAEITDLKADQANLESLLKRVRQSISDQSFQVEGGSFANNRGKLPWPVKGKTRKPSLKKGVYIATSKGSKVGAIATGKVIYADRLRGFGLLIILDHGDGYMSLYGQNDKIFIRDGDWIETGAVIASFNKSPGIKRELYFEIRKDGTALSITKWCKKQG